MPVTACSTTAAPVNKLVADFKFRARFDIGDCLAQMLATRMQEHYHAPGQNHCSPELILPVPLHFRRYLQRGFNQSWELCKVVSRHTGIPCSNKLLRKVKHTAAQSEMESASARSSNLKSAFAVTDTCQLKNVKTVTIVDDVVTTMSTVLGLATLLRSHGIRRVEAWCVARASIT